MSLPPITIPELDPASPIDPNNDLLLIRQGFNDRKVTAGQLNTPYLGNISILPDQLVQSDVVLVGRNNGSGYDNYLVPPQYLGFLNGTLMWFWSETAPLGWTVVPNSGDKVLATVLPGGETYQYNTFGYKGSWQQEDHTLTLNQIPPHRHRIFPVDSASPGPNKIGVAWQSNPTNFSNVFETEQNIPAGQPHNHGNQWRPEAAVGILCHKNKMVGQ